MVAKPISSTGERGAIVGYAAQYKIAAELVYPQIVGGQLEWIRLADPEAGKADDLVIATTGRLDAYQVKWGEIANTTSFRDLAGGANINEVFNGSGLLGELAQAWNKLTSDYPGRAVFTHLLSRNIASPQGNIPHVAKGTSKPYLPYFLRECFFEFDLEVREASLAHMWRPAWEVLEKAAGLVGTSFLKFVAHCKIEFGYQINHQAGALSRDESRRQADVDELAEYLFQKVGADKRVVQVSRDQLLAELGWDSRHKFRFHHEFPIHKLYQPISATISEIDSALEEFSNGYVALLGTPGSGKSTTLTDAFRYRRNCRIVRYYAFIPDTAAQLRGEAADFLHDITLALQQLGFHGDRKSQPKTREEHLERLGQQFAELNADWCETGILTVLVVDGLDHIDREQLPVRSLLSDLPHPTSIPDGVLIILGSQTLELKDMLPGVKTQLNEPGRQLHMRPLTRPEVISMMSLTGLAYELPAMELESVWGLSGGHPLAASYLLQSLLTYSTADAATVFLRGANQYEGHIDRTYTKYWQRIDTAPKLRELLGRLARLRLSFDLPDILRWAEEESVKLLIADGSAFFLRETPTRWRFFHNSFRQFILQQTALDVLGTPNPTKDKAFHLVLAEIFKAEPRESRNAWESLYHYSCADRSDRVLAISTQDYFRAQFYSLRPLAAILDDIAVAMRAAKSTTDAMAIIRCMLVEHEIRERHDALGQIDLHDLLLSVRGVEALADYIWDGHELLAGGLQGLTLCEKLVARGYTTSARALFDASEPLELLGQGEKIAFRGSEREELEAWACIAFHFREIEQVLGLISRLQVVVSEHENEADQIRQTRWLQDEVMISLVDAVARDGTPDHRKLLRAELERQSSLTLVSRLDLVSCFERPTSEEGNEALSRWLTAKADLTKVDEYERLLIARLLIMARQDFAGAKQWIDGIQQPPLYRWTGSGRSLRKLEPFSNRIGLNRLLAATGAAVSPTQAVPDAKKLDDAGHVVFERHLVTIANLSGRAMRGETLPPTEIIRELRPALSCFELDYEVTRHWHAWYEIEGARTDYFDFMVLSVAQHGPEAVRLLSDAFASRWTDQTTSKYWNGDLRREISIRLHRAGDERHKLLERLELIENEIGVWEDVHERLTSYASLALSWEEVDETNRAGEILPVLLRDTFAIYHRKDRQLQRWVDFLGKASVEDPKLVTSDIPRFAGAIAALEKGGQGRGTQDAIVEFLALVVRLNPAEGWQLFEWLAKQSGLSYASGVAGLLLGAIRSSSPPMEDIFILTRRLLVPFESSCPETLAKELGRASGTLLNQVVRERLLLSLARTIEVKSYPADRPAWWKAITEGLRDSGTKVIDIEQRVESDPEKSDPSDSSVELKSGKKLALSKVKETVTNFNELKAVIDAWDNTKYFPWRVIIAPLISTFSAEQVRLIPGLSDAFSGDDTLIALCSGRLQALGFDEEARVIAEKILGASKASGWDVDWDGGSRQRAMRTLINIDPTVWRPRAIQTFVDDYLAEFRYPSNLLHNLEEIAEIFFGDIPWNVLWPEIRHHVYSLSQFSLSDCPPAPDSVGSFSVQEMLWNLTLWVARIPIDEMRGQTHLALCDLVLVDPSASYKAQSIRQLLGGKGIEPIQGLAILQDMLESVPQLASEFFEMVDELRQSQDYSTRQTAINLAAQIGLPTTQKREPLELPLAYTIELPEIDTTVEAVPTNAVKPGDPYPDLEDPVEKVRPYISEVEWLANVTEIPIANVLYRTVALMQKLAPENARSAEGERNLRTWLSEIDLKMSFNRPRPQLVLLALGYVVAELVDAGKLTARNQRLAFFDLYRYEPRLSRHEPVGRPMVIVPPIRESESQSKEEWVALPELGADAAAIALEDGRHVLGELTRFRDWDWALPTETRYSMTCHPDWRIADQVMTSSDFFPRRQTWCALNYPDFTGADKVPVLVILGHPGQVAIGSTEWIAINPQIARTLGWTESSDGLFRWVNNAKETMVESIWWQDGPMDRQPPRLYETSGEGWLVVASLEGFQAIAERFRPMVRMIYASRELKEKGHARRIRHALRSQKIE